MNNKKILQMCLKTTICFAKTIKYCNKNHTLLKLMHDRRIDSIVQKLQTKILLKVTNVAGLIKLLKIALCQNRNNRKRI